MSFWGNIGNALAGIGRQINPFDHGATFQNPNPQQPQQPRVDINQLAAHLNQLHVQQQQQQAQQQIHPALLAQIQNLMRGANLHAGQQSIINANQQLQNNAPRFGPLTNPAVRNAYMASQAQGNNFNVPSALGQSLTHNPVTDAAGAGVKFVPQLAANYANAFGNLGTRAAGGQNRPIQQNFTDPFSRRVIQASGATGTNRQLASDVGQVGLAIGAGALGKVVEPLVTGAVGAAAPGAAQDAITLARLGLHQAPTPVISNAIRYGTNALEGGLINTGFGAVGAAGQKGATVKDVAKTLPLGFGTGVAFGAGGTALGDILRAIHPLDQTGGEVPAFMRNQGAQDAQSLLNRARYQQALTAFDKSPLGMPADTVPTQIPVKGARSSGGRIKVSTPTTPTSGVGRVRPDGSVVTKVTPLNEMPSVSTPGEARQLANTLLPKTQPVLPVAGAQGTGLVDTVAGSSQTSSGLKDMISSLSGGRTPLANKTTLASAANRISTDPAGAYQFAMGAHGPEENATAVLLAKQYEAQGHPDLAANLIVQKTQQALKAGQGNQIYATWDKLSPETIGQVAAKTIEKYNATARKPISNLTPEQYQGFVDQAKHIQTLADGSREKGMATQNLLKSIGQLVPSSKGDKAFALYRTGLLTGFRTPGKIAVSHAVSNVFEQTKNIPAAIADKGISLFTGKRGLSLTGKGNASGFSKGVSAGVDNLLHGYDTPGSGGFPQDFANQTHFSNTWHGKMADAYVNSVSRLHGSLYKPFYGAQHLNSLYDIATTNAKNAGLSGAERQSFITDFVKKATDFSLKNQEGDPHANITTPEGAALRANAEAQYTTFQNKTLLSNIASGAKKGAGNPTRYITPFTQIPSSIAMKIVDYSPVGPIKEAIQQVHAGTFDQRALSQAIGRGATGTGIMALGKALFDNGKISTAYPTDKKTQAQWKLEGRTANSVLIGGKWRSLASLGPAGDTLSVGANFAEGLQGNKKTPGSLMNAGIQGAIGGEQVVASSPYLEGLQNIGQAISSPGTKSQKVAEGLAGATIPTGVSNIASATDPLQRQTNSIGNSITNKIPGLREQNLPQVDVLGQNVQRAQGPIGSLLDPFYSSTARTGPVINELNRLNGVGLNSTPAPLTKNQTILGQKTNLNPQQLTQLQQQTGLPIGQQFGQLMNTPEYKSASDEVKQKALDNIVTNIRDQGKTNFATGNTGNNGTFDLSKLTKSAQLTLAKDSFDKSGKNYQVVGDTVLRRGTDGTITATPKVKYDYQLGTAQLTDYKNQGDLGNYLKTAQSQLDSIATQLKDPSIDPQEALTLKNQGQKLYNSIQKYKGYGGFTKGGGSGGSGSRGRTAKIATLRPPRIPRLNISRPTIKTSTPKQISYKVPSGKVAISRKIKFNGG